MEGINWWDIGLLAVAGYWAVAALLRLMVAHRDAEVADLRRQFEEYQRQRKASRRSAPENKASDPRAPRGRAA